MGAYIDNESKANDNRSSAWTFLMVGLVGMIAMVLVVTGIFPISLNPNAKFLIYGVMFAMFGLFIVLGFVSMVNSTRFEKEAKSEKNLYSAMLEYCKSSNLADIIGANIESEETDLAEEELYFKRCELLKESLSDKFMNLDEAFLDNFVDKVYSELFGET